MVRELLGAMDGEQSVRAGVRAGGWNALVAVSRSYLFASVCDP